MCRSPQKNRHPGRFAEAQVADRMKMAEDVQVSPFAFSAMTIGNATVDSLGQASGR